MSKAEMIHKENHASAFTLVELIIVVAVIGLIAAIAGSSMIRARVQANEGAVRAALKMVQSSAIQYRNATGGYPANLAALGSGYLGGGVETGTKNGYNFTLANANNNESYTAIAVPVTSGFSGTQGFCTDAYNIIFVYADPTGLVANGATCPAGGTIYQG